jgi:ankyrin repeat protein
VAASNGHEAIARLLLDKGAEVNANYKYRMTPLLEAASNGHEAIARLLLDKGAEINAMH